MFGSISGVKQTAADRNKCVVVFSGFRLLFNGKERRNNGAGLESTYDFKNPFP
jgi:hypothetical protein